MSKPRLRTTSDGLVNVMSGLGTNKSKSTNNQWVYNNTLNYAALEAAYTTDWLAGAIVDCRAEDMTRNWRRIKSEGAEDIAAYEDHLCVQSDVLEALKWSRLYGGAGILMVTNQDLSKPLDLKKIKEGSLEKLVVFDRWDLSGHDYNYHDFTSPSYEKPQFYTLRTGSQRVHHSHIVRFDGIPLPRRLRTYQNSWGLSELARAIDEVSRLVASNQGIADLMQEANVDVINREGLTEELASGEDDAIIDRYALFARMKSVVNLALLDAEEQYSRQTLNLTGVAPIIEHMMTLVSGAARTPVTRLFGTSAKGMSATGQGDLDNYYDSISASQKSSLKNPMRQLDEVLVRSALGRMPDNYDYVWNPLETPDSVEMAQAGLLRAQKYWGDMDRGLATSAQVMREYQANEDYQYDDEKLAELEELQEYDLFDQPVDTEESYEIEPPAPEQSNVR